MLKATVVVDRAVKTAWDYVMDIDNWEKWWGAGIKDLVPAWRKDAQLFWASGSSSKIIDFTDGKMVQIEGAWSDLTITMSAVGQKGALIELVEGSPKKGASYSDGGAAQKNELQKSLDKLKARIENETGNEAFNADSGEKPSGSDSEYTKLKLEIRNRLQEHIENMCNFVQDNPNYQDIPILGEKLLSGENLEYAVSFIAQNLMKCVQKKEIINTSQTFPEWIIAISLCPWIDPAEIRTHMPGGYINLLASLTSYEDKFRTGKHGAHWIFCTDQARNGVHLTLVPNPNVKTLHVQPILAMDFLSSEEKRRFGIA